MDEIRILVVEDEFSINDTLCFALKKEGYKVKGAYTGDEGIKLVGEFKPDLVLLDVMLPDMSGFDICRKINNETFIIMLTARDEMIDKLLGMEIGADDYITKPFELREVIMRIRVILRRAEKQEERKVSTGIIVDLRDRRVFKNGIEIQLKRKEFDLLNLFNENKGKVFTREELLDKIWGYDYYGDTRTVDVHIRRLRSALGEDKNESTIETVFGIGYVMR